MKLRFLWPGVVVLLFAAIIAFAVWRDVEPSLHGQPLSYWIEPWRSKAESPESVAAAYAAMDSTHVRWLMRQMNWKPSRFRKALARLINNLGDIMSSQTQGDRREVVADALGRLGERARPAIPTLRRMATTTVEPRGWQARCAAMAALIRLGEEAVTPMIETLRDAKHTNWTFAADVVARLGTNTPGAPELFETTMASSNPVGVRVRALMLYRHVQPDATRTAQVVTQAMDAPLFQVQGLYTLQSLGINAASAAPTVAALLTDTNAQTRRLATNTLRIIAPALAPQFGIR